MKTLERSYMIYLVWEGAKPGTIFAHWLPSNYEENIAFGIVTQRDRSKQRVEEDEGCRLSEYKGRERVWAQKSGRRPGYLHVPRSGAWMAWGLLGVKGLSMGTVRMPWLWESLFHGWFSSAKSQTCPLPQLFGIWVPKSYSPLLPPSWLCGSHCLCVVYSPAAQSSRCGPAAPQAPPQTYLVKICMLVRSVANHMLTEAGTLVCIYQLSSLYQALSVPLALGYARK